MRFSGRNRLVLAVCFAFVFSGRAYSELVAEPANMARPTILSRPTGVGSHPVERIDEKQDEFAELRNLLGDLFADITGLARNSFEVRWDYREDGVVAAIVTAESLRDAELASSYQRGKYKELKKLQEDAKIGRIKKPAVLLVSSHLVDWALEQVELKDALNGSSETRTVTGREFLYQIQSSISHGKGHVDLLREWSRRQVA